MLNPPINSGQRLPNGIVAFLFTGSEGSTNLAQRDASGAGMHPYQLAEYERSLESLHSQLDDAAFPARWAAGRAMTPEQAVAYGLECPGRIPLTIKPSASWHIAVRLRRQQGHIETTGGVVRTVEIDRPGVADQFAVEVSAAARIAGANYQIGIG